MQESALMEKLAKIVLLAIEFFDLVDDAVLDSDTAIQYLEEIGAQLGEATEGEREAVRQAAREKLAWYAKFPDEYGYRPRMSEELRKLLEGVASGEMFGWEGCG
jgi:hypothetical protein